MAQRRMFALKIIDTDKFLVMPATARLLYYELAMRADDDGFVDSPKKIMKISGCTEDDYKVLSAKQYIIPFDTGICVIRDWRIHNYIQNDRKHETHYKEELKRLTLDGNGSYKMDTECIQNTSKMDTQVRLGKDRLGKDSKRRFAPPTLEEVREYIKEKGYNIDADKWWNFYSAKGWMIGKTKMKLWHRAIATWLPEGWKAEREKSEKEKSKMAEWTKKNKDRYNL